ncbi:hypothetical protein [Virgibacillus salinus]|uniref:Uncharacterized protein n=1 Tax=Virgibacillus salinus TaxID=553311 RepID=A0A1H0Y0Q5_9BACI|nr:hypothetical protein [Virgibacillus salinus]SDQ08690.1 hypothetical protein SAMN05216231_0349 [Virgibacillus salinus]
MNHLHAQQRQKIVEEELKKLEEKQYIDNGTYLDVLHAHNQYYIDQEDRQQISGQNVEKVKKQSVPKAPKPKKAKKVLSSQEIRDRNITWSLILGVVLLLIGGLVLATSTWDTLTDWKKTGFIGLVSLLFFGLAYFTTRILKIEKTAFAFHVLGSLFLPIVILSLGYFELFGAYFSFSGEGRYLYGAAGSLVILPVYLLLSIKLASRLFVWFSFVTFTVFAGFLIASLGMSVDGFYLGIIAFNAVLIAAYHYADKQGRFQLFTQEFVLYIQANLILSTLLMLVFYESELIYSFNLMLTAVIYFSMIFVTNHKEYHFVFSALLVYGAYQLIEFSTLNEVGAIVYALLGFVFVVLPNFIKDSSSLQKAFQFTSAIVSAGAFVFISLEGILMNMNVPSFVLLLAYLIIALNFTYLTNKVKRTLFSYLSPVFFMAAFYEVVLLVRDLFDYEYLGLPMFIAGLFLYIVFGCFMKLDFFQLINRSSRDIGGVVMVLSILLHFGVVSWWQVGTMFLLLAIVSLFMDQFEHRVFFTSNRIASWIHALSIGLAVVSFFTKDQFFVAAISVDAGHLVLAGIIVLVISILWKKLKRKAFSENAFFVAQGFYVIGMMRTFLYDFDDNFRALIVLGGIGMAYLLYRKTKWIVMPYLISGTSLLFYFTVLYAVHTQFNIQSDLYHSLQFVVGSLLLLGTGIFIGNEDRKIVKAFWWIGHIYLPFSLLVTYMFNGEEAVWAFLLAAVIYGISVLKVNVGWKVNTFLYACFTSFWITVSLAMLLLDWNNHVHYAFLITSGVLAVGWYLSNRSLGRRIAFYIVPFSLIGIRVFTSISPFDLLLFVVTVLYGIGLLWILHKEKWDFLNAIPLLLLYQGMLLYSYDQLEWDYSMQVAVTGFVLIVLLVGKQFYQLVFQGAKEKGEPLRIDWYTVVGFIAAGSLYLWTTEDLWTKLLPGLLLVGSLLLQNNRIPFAAPKWVIFVACAYLLQPYYSILVNSDLPELMEREMYVLPWVVLVILLKKVADNSLKTLINNVQWAVLVIVSLLLIQDGMASSTIYDALIVGTLALVSIIGGMAYQMKSFFFVGTGVLLLNVFLQTRPYWGNLPWWMYLLITGSILIAVASYNEWHKQKTSDGKDTLISVFNKKIIQKIKNWD